MSTTYFHQVAHQVHSFPTSCGLPRRSSLDYIRVLAHALTTHLHFLTVSNYGRRA